MLAPLLNLAGNIIYLYILCIVAWAVLSTLISFGVVNPFQPIVQKLMYALNRLVLPTLRPIRKYMPNTGGIDLSPIVLILLLNCVVGIFYTHFSSLAPFVHLIGNFIYLYSLCVISWCVVSILLYLQVLNPYQPLVQQVMLALSRVVEPALKPIRKFLPDIGIDFSPVILLLLLHFAAQTIMQLFYRL